MTVELSLRQASFPDLCPITAAVEALSDAGSADQRGAVFTRPEVVDFILDLTGYTADRPLWDMRLLEPAETPKPQAIAQWTCVACAAGIPPYFPQPFIGQEVRDVQVREGVLQMCNPSESLEC